MLNLTRIVEEASRRGYAWDFFEGSPDVEVACLQTVPGAIVAGMREGGISEMAIGLFAAFAAKRSLACWFKYCVDVAPLFAVNSVIECWFRGPDGTSAIDKSLVKPAVPIENGKEIRDCRRTDTLSASSSVANCASYAIYRSQIFAITAISHAHIAFESNPDASVRRFEEWLIHTAFPQALDLRRLTPSQQWAMADFEIPEQLRN